MNDIELYAAICFARGWILLLTFTSAVVVVFALRKVCRWLFGVERAFQLWSLPPLAMLVSQVPHAANVYRLPSVIYQIASATQSLAVAPRMTDGWSFREGALVIWVFGTLISALVTVVAQRRFGRYLRNAIPLNDRFSKCGVWRASRVDVGPALVGVWHPRVIVPADFETRFEPIEQTLILAHECTHASRWDNAWSFIAQTILVVLWFNPLAWLALQAMRRDQELACDAAVLRDYPAHRRSYANAMLKTQPATFPLPVGCNWSSHHPITERIAMLNSSSRQARHKTLGLGTLLLLLFGSVGLAYAATSGSVATIAKVTDQGLYQLDLVLRRGGNTLSAPTICVTENQSGEVRQSALGDSMQFAFAVSPLASGEAQIHVTGDVDEDRNGKQLNVTLRGPFDQAMAMKIGATKRPEQAIDLLITPHEGCAASSSTPATVEVSIHLNNVGAQEAAQSVASRSGLKLANPAQLDHRAVTFNFDKIPAAMAMQYIAAADGRKVVVDGRNVRFESN